MPQVNPISVLPRPVGPIPGVPDVHSRALNRRLRLEQQLRSYRMTSRPPASVVASPVNGPGGPAPA